MIRQVPYGVNPTSTLQQGLFVMPIDKFLDDRCFTSYDIAHLRDSEGYQTTFYD